MSTNIGSTFSDRVLLIEGGGPTEVSLAIGGEPIDVDRAEFLAAVAAELDVIVIPRSDLPEVTTDDTGQPYLYGTPYYGTAADHRADALYHLALAEHLDAHPPVDEAQVDALADLAAQFYGRGPTELARRLVATGRVTVTTGEAGQ